MLSKSQVGKSATELPQELQASKWAATISVGLAAVKLVTGFGSGSLSLIASGVDSVFDALVSSAGFFFLRLSLEPADEEHPYGHSRIESIASLGQGALLMVIALTLTYSASLRFGDRGHRPENSPVTLIVPAVCALVTLGLWLYMRRVARKTGSPIIAGDGLHYFSDLAGNVLLVIGFLAAKIWRLHNVDVILTFILCLFLLMSGLSLIIDAVKDLVDFNDSDTEQKVRDVVKGFYPEALGIARMRSRKAGRRTAMDVELVSCRRLKFEKVHEIGHHVLKKINDDLPHVDLIIHSEPCSRDLCPTEQSCKLENY